MARPQPQHAPDDSDALEHAVAGVAAAMADPSRVKMLSALMDGRAWTATELSAVTDVAPSTASAHLNRLINSGLIICVAQGRHRYYRLTGSDIAALIENMMGVSWRRIDAPKSSTPASLRIARTCYDHLAGEVAVQIYSAMAQQGWITPEGSAVTLYGQQQFAALQIDLSQRRRRKPCCGCLDWSERRLHPGGYAGAAMLTAFDAQRWLTRQPGYREVAFTEAGRRNLRRLFDITFP
ncbi:MULTISPECIES: winged helix-turn-helix domain-containing protein [unclassified Pantoea]|jgi:DNA-binding transcriptional ArsR family regulator|uniref:ArsR/SmtB family transcription factor n=1 Tax=unclassified Pantoea TaxID=2630326 RepID=UPI0023DA25B0|nr:MULTISPECIES: winged helix-turn-helix domain-containing protein [unclassified Pantoea]MDF2040778.1 winged helix-turn-helix domain-containing protein [Pantoea sp. Cr_R14]MDF2071185.1 winged helix-turn-helix domain-containing protein [Pantoea sp. Cr_R13]MDF2080314.1 winged helix-turn-helix domain-containing protein [Pantoea sp. Cr_R21]